MIAESGDKAFVEAPPELPAGMHTVVVEEATPQGRVQAELPVATMSLGMSADRTNLTRGQRTDFTVLVSGPEALPADVWQNGTVELRIVRESQNIKMHDEKNGVIVRQLRQRDFARGPLHLQGPNPVAQRRRVPHHRNPDAEAEHREGKAGAEVAAVTSAPDS